MKEGLNELIVDTSERRTKQAVPFQAVPVDSNRTKEKVRHLSENS